MNKTIINRALNTMLVIFVSMTFVAFVIVPNIITAFAVGGKPVISGTTAIAETGVTTFDVSLPSGTVAGNLLLALIAKDDEVAMASSHGFTKAFDILGADHGTWGWYKIADADDITRTYVTFTGDSEDYVGKMYRITNFNTSNPIYAVDETGATGTSASPQAPSINTVVDTLVFAITGMDDNDVPYSLDTAGWTEQHNASVTTAGVVIGTRDANTAGATGAVDFTTNASDGWAATQIAINNNDVPTVALNSPSDTGSISDTTPDLLFTGTDPNSDEVEYRVQLDTVNTFDSQSSVADSYTEGNQDTDELMDYSLGNGNGKSQSFTGDGGPITSCKFYLKKFGSPTGNITAKLYSHGGTFGTGSIPLATLATSNTVDVTTLTTSYQLIEFTFSSPYTAVSGTKYCIGVEFNTGDGSNYLIAGSDSSSPTHEGNMATFAAGFWNAVAGTDLIFYIYSTGPLLDKYSDVPDAGFSGTGDPHPWPSGNQITFTVQAGDELTAPDTFYWRVRAIDPSGTNEYGAWSSTYSFNLTTGEVTTGDFFHLF